jgi:tungstate transport system ATP-binding protein
MADSIYQISSLEHTYGNQPVLQIDRMEIPRGAIIGLVGPNGSGKSTLLKILGLIEKPSKGEIVYNGVPVEPFSRHARFQISLLPQEPFLMKRSVFKNVAYGLKLRGEKEPLTPLVEKALMMVGLSLEVFARRPWYALSGGEAQRVALAARLALSPEVLLMDEPTAAIDAASAQLIKEAAFNAQKEWGTTLVIASHDRPWLNEVCDDVLWLFKGQLMDRENENIVFGSWQDLGNGKRGKRLTDHQILRTPEPPGPDAEALLEVVLGDDPARREGWDALHGTILRLNLERTTGKIHLTLAVGHLVLNLKLSQDTLQEKALYPGKPLSVYYDPDGILWR